MSLLAVTLTSLSSSMIQPLSCWPALTPSTTTTPTPSPSSCTTKWIIGALFYSHARPPPLPENAGCAGRFDSCSEIFVVPLRARRGIGLSVALERGAVDAADGRLQPRLDSRALGAVRGRGTEQGSPISGGNRRLSVGAFGA